MNARVSRYASVYIPVSMHESMHVYLSCTEYSLRIHFRAFCSWWTATKEIDKWPLLDLIASVYLLNWNFCFHLGTILIQWIVRPIIRIRLNSDNHLFGTALVYAHICTCFYACMYAYIYQCIVGCLFTIRRGVRCYHTEEQNMGSITITERWKRKEVEEAVTSCLVFSRPSVWLRTGISLLCSCWAKELTNAAPSDDRRRSPTMTIHSFTTM